ncbi:MAG: TetR/AcrR family transcriptional regulator [Chromatiales bacterium]|nr:TetR/AcrR family transcriptional regulator [Chromatiales bacterium]
MKKGEANRKRIVDAANQLFYHKGYNQTAFSEVADASGIPKGNFYYYFRSKEELLEAVIDDRLAGIKQMLAEWQRDIPTPRARLHRYAQIPLNELDDVLRYGCPMGSLNVELGKNQLHLQSQATEMFSLFRGWLEQQFDELGLGEKKVEYALHLLSVAQGAALIGNVYRDRTFIAAEVARMDKWIATL